MAASPPSDMSMENTDEEMSSVVETEDCSVTENGDKPGEKDPTITEPETDDPFKKPALFAAPSVASKRSNVASSSKPKTDETISVKENNEVEKIETTSDTLPQLPNENVPVGKRQEEDKGGENDNSISTVKNKPAAKPRVLPKGPIAGKFPPIPYTEPPWGGRASDIPYSLEILKNGTIVDTVPLTHNSFFVVGRLPVCDVSLEHPSISRYHAVIQYRGQAGEEECVGEEKGFYVHDLGSTHGTVVNKNKIPPKTYIRLRVGHVLKFGGSTRLFILQGPEFDEEEESDLTVTELRERARKQKDLLEKRMMGDGSDDDDLEEKEEKDEGENQHQGKPSKEDSGCSWGMDEEVVPEEDENEENPFSTEFQEDQEAAYLKDPKKALQGFYDREGEELEFEYEDKSHGMWLCRIKLPVDDALGRQLVAEVTHTGKKKDTAVQCCLEACRMLEARGLLRQEAVSRKRKKKNWEDEDYYDSDDDTFLDRTGTVERKRQERMKKAGKISERPETYESLVAKLSEVEKELEETQKKLNAGRGDSSGSSKEDSLDAFMTAVKSEAAMDAVERRKLHVHVADLRKDAQRLRKLVELTRPAQMPSLLPSGSEAEKPKKTLPLFGAMKGGSKFKLKTGTIGKLPPKRPNLPAELFNMKELPPGEEEEEEEEEERDEEAEETEDKDDQLCPSSQASNDEESSAAKCDESTSSKQQREEVQSSERKAHSRTSRKGGDCAEAVEQEPEHQSNKATVTSSPKSKAAEPSPKNKKRVMGPSKPPVQLSGQYPEDDPDYSVWLPPTGQSGDGRTHLNDKYGY
nr:kanadaptin [Solea senegalensis]